MTRGGTVARRGLIYGGGADRIGGLRMSCVGKIREGFWPSEGCWAFLFLEGGKQGTKKRTELAGQMGPAAEAAR